MRQFERKYESTDRIARASGHASRDEQPQSARQAPPDSNEVPEAEVNSPASNRLSLPKVNVRRGHRQRQLVAESVLEPKFILGLAVPKFG